MGSQIRKSLFSILEGVGQNLFVLRFTAIRFSKTERTIGAVIHPFHRTC